MTVPSEMNSELEEEIEAAVAKERAKWEKILENAQKVSDDYGVQVEALTGQLQELRRLLQEQEAKARQSEQQHPASQEKLKELEDALTRARLDCLEREKAAARRAREEGEIALRQEREVNFVV